MTTSVPPGAALHPVERLPEEWAEQLAAQGEPRYRARQIFRWVHARGVTHPDAMSDLPKALRASLREEGFSPPAQVVEARVASDGTRKLLVGFVDERRVESVVIPRGSVAPEDVYAPVEEPGAAPSPGVARSVPVTQCVSTQVGCAMGCTFCASGIAGLKRNLSAAEIVAQVLLARAQLDPVERLSGIVLMGMGEPLHNYEPVARALRLIAHPEGLALSLRRVTLSTSGLVEGIERLGREFRGEVGLAVSLHAPDDETRTRIMPVNKRHPVAELLSALKRYPLPPRKHITIEYTLIDGVNDTPAHARELGRVLRGLRVKLNLIPMNDVPGAELRASTPETVDAFQAALREQGYGVFVRRRKGDDIAAACGQLALHGERRKLRVTR